MGVKKQDGMLVKCGGKVIFRERIDPMNIQLPEGTEMCMPGDNVEMDVKLITPIAMEEGQRFAIREGGHTVGAGVVAKIVK